MAATFEIEENKTDRVVIRKHEFGVCVNMAADINDLITLKEAIGKFLKEKPL